jgi:thiol-disulfide isomerase/thioredoxin
MAEKNLKTFTTPIIVALLVIVAFLAGMLLTKTRYVGQGEAPEKIAQATPTPQQEGAVLGELASTIGSFSVTKEETCQEEGKPLVYFFGSPSCPHCTWEHPIFEEVVKKFEGLIALHNNMDTENDMEVFQRYSQINQNGIPFIVLGCRYVRVGSGENLGEEEETKALTALICKLTEGKPEKICEGVTDLIEQVE